MLSFGTIQRRDHSLSHLMKSLNPAVPVLPIGIFRYFRAVACVCIGASPNRDYLLNQVNRNAEKWACQSFFNEFTVS